MKNLKTNLLLQLIAVTAIVFSLFYGLGNHWASFTRNEHKKAYAKYLADHPFNQRPKLTPEEWKEKMPKKDRPDLAWEQNFIMTMDPAVGEPVEERLITALDIVNEYVDDPSRYAPGDSDFPWTERGPDNVGGRTRAILWDPNNENRVFAGGVDGGLWYNNDITNVSVEWQKVNDFWDNIAISCIAADPSNPNTWYVGTGEGWGNIDAVRGMGIWKTTDGGESWTHLLSTINDNFRYTQDIIVDPVHANVYAATNDGIKRSSNGGTSWSDVLSNGNGTGGNFIDDLEVAADNSLWAAVDGYGVYRSTTGTSGSWTKLNTNNGFPSFGMDRIEIATAPSDENTAYAFVIDNGELDAIYKTTNMGDSWTSVSKPNDTDPGIPANDFTRNQGWYDLISAVDPNDPDHLYAGGINLFHSFDGGDSWTQISHWYGGFGEPYVHADQHGILFKPGSSDQIVFSNDGGITYAPNASQVQPNVLTRNNGYNVTQFYACAMHPDEGSNIYLAGAQDNGTQRFDEPGSNTTTEVTGGDGMYCHIDQTSPNYQITSYVYNNYYRSVNTGVSFTTVPGGENSGRFINPTDYDNQQNILYAARDAGSLKRISNFTSSPTVSNIIVPLGNTASHIRVSEYTTESSTIFVGTGAGNIYKVTNADSSPSTTNIDSDSELPGGYISCIELGENEDEILVTFSNYGITSVWYTEDGGQNWSNKEGDLPDMPVRWALFNPEDRDEVILATEVGVWSTADFSADNPEWVPSNSGLANVRVDMLQYRPSDQQVVAATHGRGLFTGHFFNPNFANDAGILGVVQPEGLECASSINPEVVVKNFGSEPLTEVDIQFSMNGNSTQNYEWSGLIDPGENDTIALPAINYSVGEHIFEVSTNDPNGVMDENQENDTEIVEFTYGNNPVTVQIVTDRWGAETTWAISDENDNVILEGGPYVNHGTSGEYPQPDEVVCLENGCYEFTIFDSFGDGICCASGNGSYTLLDEEGNILVSGASGWNYFETEEFCVSSPVNGHDHDAGIIEILDLEEEVCDSLLSPMVKLENFGAENLTSVIINYNIDTEASNSYTWTGNLASNEMEIITLPEIEIPNPGTHTLTVSTEQPNGEPDEDAENDEAITNFDSQQGTITTLSLTTDCWGGETSWQIVNEQGEVVSNLTEGSLDNITNYTTDLCLADGCYEFNVFDAGGNGLDGTSEGCPQDGDFSIVDDEGNVLIEMDDPDFGSETSHTFCINDLPDIPGCIEDEACNYNPEATVSDHSCHFQGDECDDGDPQTVGDVITPECDCSGYTIPGCMDMTACNFDPEATVADGTCLYPGDECNDEDATTEGDIFNDDCICIGIATPGCTNVTACNYDPEATVNDGSCLFPGDPCDDEDPTTVDDSYNDNCICEGVVIEGCTNPQACNYNPEATVDDGSCLMVGDPCDDGDETTVNDMINEDCECEGTTIPGCTDPTACNFDPGATVNDGSCLFPGDPCDDGNSATVEDAFNQNCICEGFGTCAADLDENGEISTGDLLILLSNFGCSGPDCIGDINEDGMVLTSDLLILISQLGTSCEE